MKRRSENTWLSSVRAKQGLRASSRDKVGTEKRRGKRKSGAPPHAHLRGCMCGGGGGAHHVHLYII